MNEDFNFTTRIGILFSLIFIMLVFMGSCVEDEPNLISPVSFKAVEAQEPTPTPILSQKELIVQEINQVFGVDADKAFLLLQGKECAENRYLNPKAQNNNYEWGGLGIDRGIFQINSYYHPSVSDECAYDFKCNIKYAKRMFINNKGSFQRWTCGRYYMSLGLM